MENKVIVILYQFLNNDDNDRANQTVDSADIETRPEIRFKRFKYNLYTIMIVDFGMFLQNLSRFTNALPTIS